MQLDIIATSPSITVSTVKNSNYRNELKVSTVKNSNECNRIEALSF